MRPRIGVLALQGCVEPHRPHIEAAGAQFLAVRTAADLDRVQALILPGGESTTMLWLIRAGALHDPLQDALERLPAWGICAGAILLATDVKSPAQESFGRLEMTVRRNGYGRQLDSFTTTVDGYAVCFIRAPQIERVGPGVEICAGSERGATWVRKGQTMATCFHPELTARYPSPWHRVLVRWAR